jgi:transposase
MLARLLRADLIPESCAPSVEVRVTKRVLLRRRMFLVRLRTMVKNRVRALLSQHGIEPPPVSDPFGQEGLSWLKEEPDLPDPDGWLLREDAERAETPKEKIRATEGLTAELAEGDEAVGGLLSLPGMGGFFSVLIRQEVAEMRRFPSAKKFASSYTGLVPSTYASGKRITHGRLTKEGNEWL